MSSIKLTVGKQFLFARFITTLLFDILNHQNTSHPFNRCIYRTSLQLKESYDDALHYIFQFLQYPLNQNVSIKLDIFILALIYVDRVKKVMLHKPKTEKFLFVVAFMLAHKFTSDFIFDTKSWSMLGQIHPKILKKLEVEFLSCIKYDLNVKACTYSSWFNKINELVTDFLIFNQIQTDTRLANVKNRQYNPIRSNSPHHPYSMQTQQYSPQYHYLQHQQHEPNQKYHGHSTSEVNNKMQFNSNHRGLNNNRLGIPSPPQSPFFNNQS